MMHRLPANRGWAFNNDLEKPSFAPSFKHEWGNGKVCHYTLTAGMLTFAPDSTHALAGQTVPLPELPTE